MDCRLSSLLDVLSIADIALTMNSCHTPLNGLRAAQLHSLLDVLSIADIALTMNSCHTPLNGLKAAQPVG
jgi:hypothetical protein